MLRSRPTICTAKLPSGQKFEFRNIPGDAYVFEEVLIRNVYGKLLSGLQFEAKTIVDIGANIGAFAVLVSRNAHRLVAVEPDPTCAELLRRNLRLNKLDAAATVICAAAGGAERRAQLLLSATDPELNCLANSNAKADVLNRISIEVDVLPLERIFEMGNVDTCNLLKIDCEGSEFEVISESNEDAFRRVEVVLCEVHRKSESDNGVSTIVNRLRHMGFHVDSDPHLDDVDAQSFSVEVGHGVALVRGVRPTAI